jgi:hypothetical protein
MRQMEYRLRESLKNLVTCVEDCLESSDDEAALLDLENALKESKQTLQTASSEEALCLKSNVGEFPESLL